MQVISKNQGIHDIQEIQKVRGIWEFIVFQVMKEVAYQNWQTEQGNWPEFGTYPTCLTMIIFLIFENRLLLFVMTNSS